jgi:hypothetical protein
MGQNVVAFDAVADFEVVDQALARNVGAGAFISTTKEGDTRMDRQCIADNRNEGCIQMNNFCATNVVCPEVDAGPL